MDGETLPVDEHSHVRVARLLCLLGAILASLYAPLYGAGADAPISGSWLHVGVAGLLVALIGASYISDTVRRRHVAITWGLLYAIMGWAAVLAALNEFAGGYAVGVLLVYAVFGGVVALGSASIRPALTFLLAGLLAVGGALLWAPALETSPWVLIGAMGVVALVEGATLRWVLSVCARLRTQGRTLREQRDLLDRLVETSPHAVVRVDGSGAPTDANGRAEEILGTDVEAVSGDSDAPPQAGPPETRRQRPPAPAPFRRFCR